MRTPIASGSEASGATLGTTRRIGTHNSYKQAIEPGLYDRMAAVSREMRSLDYTHLPIDDQLNLGIRALEIDIYNDPAGGRYARPLGLRLLAAGGVTPEPWDAAGVMSRPGFKVMHDADFDFRSDTLDFADCLRGMAEWSRAHPGHACVIVTMNLKDDRGDYPGSVEPAPFGRDALDRLDGALLAGLGPERLLTPDDVRGDDESVNRAVVSRGWPSERAAAGRFLFVLDERGAKQAAYVDGHPGLRGRVMFVDAPAGRPESAVLILNEPGRDEERIRSMVAAGYLVRTRADAGTEEARRGDLGRFEAALRSGAQVISTDYPIPDRKIHPTYRVRFASGGFVDFGPGHSGADRPASGAPPAAPPDR